MKVENIRENHKKVVSEERALRRKKIYEKIYSYPTQVHKK